MKKWSLCLVLVCSFVWASRIVVKNPQSDIQGKVVDEITFGEDRFVIVEVEDTLRTNTLETLERTQGKESVFIDFEVGPAKIIKSDTPDKLASAGWHVDRLKYNSLPDKFKGKAIRLGQKAVVGAVDKKLGKKFARGLDAGINAYRGEPTAGIPSWVPSLRVGVLTPTLDALLG